MRLLRATFLPLFALTGLALCAWGVVDWWTFHRAIFVEEKLALQALADEVGSLRYRREDDLRPDGHRVGETNAREQPPEIEVPWSVPFVGRVEYVRPEHPPNGRLSFPLPPKTRAAIDRVLLLPGLRGFDGGNVLPRIEGDADLSLLPLGRPLPELPEETLTPAVLAEPLPRGRPLDDEAKREFVENLLRAWSAEESDRPRLVHQESHQRGWRGEPVVWETLYLLDGERSLSYQDEGISIFTALNGCNLTLADEQGVREFVVEQDRREETSYFASDLAEKAFRETWSPLPRAAYDPERGDSDDGGVLGVKGERVVRIERIDDRRAFIEARFDPPTEDDGDPWRFRAVVRTDLGYALERWDYGYLQRGSDAYWALDREVRRLESIEGETVVVERIYDYLREPPSQLTEPSFPDETSPADEPPYERFAVDFDPAYSEAVFDPASYDVRFLPRPEVLPVVRRYRIAWAAGGVCCFVGFIGMLVVPSRQRRTTSAAPPSWPRPRFRLRFGMLSVAAAMLTLIGVAGWIKERFDDARDEIQLLKDLYEVDEPIGFHGGPLTFTRAEPALPWALVSTDALPVGAPVTAISLNQAPSRELADRLLARSPVVRITVGERPSAYAGLEDRGPPPAIGVDLPEFTFAGRDDAEPFPPIERGEPLTSTEADEVLAELRTAWSRAHATAPDRYVLRRWSDFASDEHADEVLLRDGERYWSVDSFAHPRQVWAKDERFFRRFGFIDGEWRPIIRWPEEDAFWGFWELPGTFRANVSNDALDFDQALALPSPPFARLVPFERDERHLDFALLRGDRDLAVGVERLDEQRYRIEVRPSERPDPLNSAKEWDVWTAVVRRDLDWYIEDCEASADYAVDAGSSWAAADLDPFVDDRWDPFSRAGDVDPVAPDEEGVVRQRVARRRNDLRRVDGRVVAVESRWMGADWIEGSEPRRHFAGERIAIDPPIDERIFERPSLDAPDPAVPREKGWLTWYAVAFGIGVATLVVQTLRSVVRGVAHAFRKRERPALLSTADAGSANEGAA